MRNNSLINILSLNINSLSNKWDILTLQLDDILEQLDIICLTEINIPEHLNNLYHLHNYNAFFSNRTNRRGGGLVIYSKKHLNIMSCNINKTNSYESIEIVFSHTDNKLVVTSIYRPPNLNIKDFLDELETNIERNVTCYKEHIVLGDLNIDLLNDDNNNVIKYKNIMASYGFIPLITTHTRHDLVRGSFTSIDHIYYKTMKDYHTSAVIRSDISDHDITYAGIWMVENNTANSEERIILHPRLNNTMIHNRLNEMDWRDCLEQQDPEDIYNTIKNKFNEIYTDATYHNTRKKRKNNKKWFTEELKNLCKERDRLYKKWVRNRNNMDNKEEYKTFRNKLNKKIFKTKQLYYKNIIDKSKNDTKQMWRTVNSLIGRKAHSVDEVINKYLGTHYNIEQIVNKFNTNFKDKTNLPANDCKISTCLAKQTLSRNSFYLFETNITEIINIINKTKPEKSPGKDNIRIKDIKATVENSAAVITHLINKIFEKGVIPNTLKHSIIKPIYKHGNHLNFDNYRPICILSFLHKIMENCLNKRLNSYLNKYNILKNHIYGFRKGKSTQLLLTEFTNTVNNALNHNKHILVLFLDFSKAFDTINHEILLNKLQDIGIRGITYNLFKSFLEGRTTSVKINNIISNSVEITQGIPQGSILSPTLYNILVNDMNEVLQHSRILIYADDTTIFTIHKDPNTAFEHLQQDFNNITKWCHDNKILINSEKSKLMHIRVTHHVSTVYKLKCHKEQCLHDNIPNDCPCNTFIKQTPTHKYLGLTIDEHHKMNSHILNVIKSLRLSLPTFYNLNYFLDTKTYFIIYKALIESTIRYALPAWGNQNSSLINNLQDIQNRFFKRKKATTFLNIKELYNISILNMYFYDQRFKQKVDHDKHTRSITEVKYSLPLCNNNYGYRCLNYTIPALLNELPSHIRINTNKKQALKQIKEYYMTKKNTMVCNSATQQSNV